LRSQILNIINKMRNSLGLKPFLVSIVSILILNLILYLQNLNFFNFSYVIEKDVLLTLLNIITSSMLTVFVFSVGAMVASYTAATSAGSPRVLNLILSDHHTQNAAASFIGAFIYASLATFSLKLDLFNSNGLLFLLVTVAFVFIWVIYVFIFWMDNIARLGQIPNLIEKSKNAAQLSLKESTIVSLCLCNSNASSVDFISSGFIIDKAFGFVIDIDFKKIEFLCKENNFKILLLIKMGDFVNSETEIFKLSNNQLSMEDFEKIKSCFKFSIQRNLMCDPFYCFEILSEIAAKALSPGVNDPGTAKEVITNSTQILSNWIGEIDLSNQNKFESIYANKSVVYHLVISAFENIRIYGLKDVSVANNLLCALRHIYDITKAGSDKELLKLYLIYCHSNAKNELKYLHEHEAIDKWIARI
jgi:uncharacterized membrane protein